MKSFLIVMSLIILNITNANLLAHSGDKKSEKASTTTVATKKDMSRNAAHTARFKKAESVNKHKGTQENGKPGSRIFEKY